MTCSDQFLWCVVDLYRGLHASVLYERGLNEVDAEMVANFAIIVDGPEGKFAVFADLDTTYGVLQAKRPRPVDGRCLQRLFERHAHRGHREAKHGLHILTIGSTRVKVCRQSYVQTGVDEATGRGIGSAQRIGA